jgi:ketosteroid isomerase-like protein
MSQSSEDLVTGFYTAFGRGDVPAILTALDDDIAWHVPETLPHGGDFRGREDVGRFFQGIGEQWESIELELDDLVSGDDRVVALVRLNGKLRATGEEARYASAHVWTIRNGSPVRFDEYVNAPLSLPAARAVTT